ncbi:amino acid permease [Ulvibacter antarcticus]|uniref:Arginine/agmatine antiporter n=1 Tax=Ulvibacter antarcticus TaxID=442714 RepID=A0A3L9Z4J0_9FLAO|nr:amino acid permease [Ulvibacter antarcticus]RMA66369.1 amino acid/polyamine/organocation transporter (APC superfamily) [Ulvibacter antarcticus]
MTEGSKPKKIGLITATSLVVGNMIGSGIFVLPAALASYGSISLLGWFFTAAGALILAKIFSNFSKILRSKSGGPYVYSRAGFGDFIGFLVAWGYWISCWVVNAAIAVAIVSALTIFFPILETNSILAVVIGLAFIWFFTWINSEGVKTSGKFQVVTTILKVVPLLFVILFGGFFFSLDNFPEFNTSNLGDFDAFSTVGALTLFAFLGLECATVPAANVKDPEKTIPKATMLGTTISTLIYILGTVVLFGMLPIEKLSTSPAPFAEAAKIIGGEYAGYFVAGGAAIAAIGALNGWILMMGQIPMASATDKLFPRIFKKENKNGVPIAGLVIGSFLSSVLMLMNYTEGLVEQFEFIVLLTTLTCLVPYLFTAASYAMVVINKKLYVGSPVSVFVLSGLGFVYSMWAIYGSGNEAVFYGFLLLLLGIPFYVLMKWNNRKDL